MKINREDFLRSLEFVSAGLASREFIQQSTCFVFKDGRIWTFNDEISCSCPSPVDAEIAVPAGPLLDLLRKMEEDHILLEVGEKEISIRGRKKMAGIAFESEVNLPIEEVEPPDNWRDLPDAFLEAVKSVSSCACKEESQLVLTCVHISPEFMECCDRYQFARYSFDTGFDKDILVRADTLGSVRVLAPSFFSETRAWLHFKNQFDVVCSIRKTDDVYPLLDEIFKRGEEGVKTSLPDKLDDVVEKAQVFVAKTDDSYVVVDLKADGVVIEGRGTFGWYKEKIESSYTGEDVRFRVSPILLVEIGKRSRECIITKTKLFASMGNLEFVTSTEVEKDAPASAD